jgi:acyl-[acyl-carrier-protein]-phospholipid O-acyltransferase/long-chain-fatty-acid--[acyl-carrier-protein] ligase
MLPSGVDCCVVEIPDSTRGARIVAAVTGSVDDRALIKKMSEELPSIAIPKSFVVIPELPKMGSGKVDFRAVTSLVREMV